MLARRAPPNPLVRYRVAGSRAGQHYELVVDGSDVNCSCRGFEFRGQCKHARRLKDALSLGKGVPDAYELLE